jgi:hypothetical protein
MGAVAQVPTHCGWLGDWARPGALAASKRTDKATEANQFKGVRLNMKEISSERGVYGQPKCITQMDAQAGLER